MSRESTGNLVRRIWIETHAKKEKPKSEDFWSLAMSHYKEECEGHFLDWAKQGFLAAIGKLSRQRPQEQCEQISSIPQAMDNGHPTMTMVQTSMDFGDDGIWRLPNAWIFADGVSKPALKTTLAETEKAIELVRKKNSEDVERKYRLDRRALDTAKSLPGISPTSTWLDVFLKLTRTGTDD